MLVSGVSSQPQNNNQKINFKAGSAAMLPKYAQDVFISEQKAFCFEKSQDAVRAFFKRFSVKKYLHEQDLIIEGKQKIGSEINRMKKLNSASLAGKSKLLEHAKLNVEGKVAIRDSAEILGEIRAREVTFTDISDLDEKGRVYASKNFYSMEGANIDGYIESPNVELRDITSVFENARINAKNLKIDSTIFNGAAIAEDASLDAAAILGMKGVIKCKKISSIGSDVKVRGAIHTEDCSENLLRKYPQNIFLHDKGWFDELKKSKNPWGAIR